ncbi:caltractin, putative [Entamoeba invadens IP1]|uniref:Caltractin, putative n=1 Tax=Entamoeba invadens IP1 TaxID=370355 RepID=A0A0A1TVI3_ENTIV|nr:caltractin, putative [Entamoeba invadens IP1]ELP84411.1 caltractin, putative [Entamoeba invadens IP1]|eukprot:XP_004183757.1 caltractin, putative [Entamoeba invadens IP1]
MSLAEEFEELDTDHNGLINYNEFLNAFKDNKDEKVDNQHLKMVFDMANIEENGFLTSNEFVHVMTNLDEVEDKSDRSLYTLLFHLIDDDNSGTLEINELARFMRVLKTELNEEELKTALSAMDSDSDGKVDLEDTLKFFLSDNQRNKLIFIHF